MKTIIQNVRHLPEWQALKTIRTEIFVLEQGLDKSIVEDMHDETCVHILYEDSGKVIASCRVRCDQHTAYIERVSVTKAYRNRSLGKQLVLDSLKLAHSKHISEVTILAQTHVASMYEKYGFEISGSMFQIYGTPHIKMIKHIV